MDINTVFERIDRLSVAVIGDFCLDVYWEADMRRSVLSRETPHYPLPVISERMSAGGAGNVAVNISALQPCRVAALGVTGADWRGDALKKCLDTAGVDTKGLICDAQRVTNCYIKPMRHGYGDVVYEDPRLDFENYGTICSETEADLLKALSKDDYDVICVCDQMQYGCITDALRAKLCELGKNGKCVIVDSRDRIGLYTDVIVKPNEIESLRVVGNGVPYEEAVRKLAERTQKPAIVTLGKNGCLVCEDGVVSHVPAFKSEPPLDICGAGDTFMAAFACAYGAGAALREAACMANAASCVTVRKLHTTGTADREEIKAVMA